MSSSPPPRADSKKPAAKKKDTLEARCRSVIAANLERYPPEAFSIISEDYWDSIVQERNESTRPSMGTGGLDGTGRLLPAVSAPFLLEIERLHPELSESTQVDRLAWKDCVEYSFHSGSISRPPALQFPWPLLVKKLRRSGEILLELLSSETQTDRNQELFQRHARALSESPMNVSLLQASGVGKTVKKFIKACSKEKPESLNVDTKLPVMRGRQSASVKAAVSPLALLEETLQRWKDMAANSGVQASSNDAKGNQEDVNNSDQEDLRLAESCQSWRELYLVLKQHEENRRAKQGERMREIRRNLATGRPRVIKVRASKSRHDSILDRADKKKGGARFGSSSAPAVAGGGGNAKMRALKKESRIATTLSKSSARPDQKKKNSFGAAVASTNAFKPTGSKATAKRRATGHVMTMPGGKRMKIPNSKASGSQTRPSFARR